MAVIDQLYTANYSLYNADCCEVLPDLPDESIDFSIYSPPFATRSGQGIYTYSSSERDFSNALSYEDFFEQYGELVADIARVTKPGCFSAVHCADVSATCNLGNYLTDFPGDIIRLHQEHGFRYVARHVIWKEPLAVRNRTMAKGLAHQTIVENANLADVAGADFLLMLRKNGDRAVPVTYPNGLLEYAGETPIRAELRQYRAWKGKQTENLYSHAIWRQYASSVWDDIRISNVLPYEAARDAKDERHVHPLQLDVIERALTLRTIPGERVLTPYMGVGSEVYQSVKMGRKAVGIELKPSYYRQAVKNCARAKEVRHKEAGELFPEEITS
jgi:DNA modification methylase